MIFKINAQIDYGLQRILQWAKSGPLAIIAALTIHCNICIFSLIQQPSYISAYIVHIHTNTCTHTDKHT